MKPDVKMLLYLTTSLVAVSAVLVQEDNGMQRSVNYVSKALQGDNTRYMKLAYAILMASCKLHHYFMAHEITIPSSYPLGLLLHNKDATGRISKWAAELPFDLHFVTSTSIKSQVLADFVAKWTPQLAEVPDTQDEVT